MSDAKSLLPLREALEGLVNAIDRIKGDICTQYPALSEAWVRASAALFDNPAPTDQPANANDRFLLNAYGRKCYDLGRESALKTAVSPSLEGRWQAIETAPKDGTEIVALVSGRPYFVSWTTHGDHHAEPWWRDREGYGLTEPTHWQPLPPAPATKETP